MKKALVHTHFNIPNYGANLQALSTSHILRCAGYDPVYLDYRSIKFENFYVRSVSTQQYKLHHDFVTTNLKITERVYNYENYKSFIETNYFDLLVTGSDAVFKLQSDSNLDEQIFPNPFWLLEGRNQEKLSISPSAMGSNLTHNLTIDQRRTLQNVLNSYRFLSVRDNWTMKQLRSIGTSPVLSRDPVSYLHLLDKRFHGKAFSTKIVVGALPKYFSEAWVEQLKTELKKHDLEFVDVGVPENTSVELNPIEWYNLIANSSGYIGVRFHPLIIATTHGVPVFSLDQYARTPWKRRMSKSYLHLCEQDLQRHHCTKLGYRFLTPKKVVEHILTQKNSMVSHRLKLEDDLNRMILDVSAGAKERLY